MKLNVPTNLLLCLFVTLFLVPRKSFAAASPAITIQPQSQTVLAESSVTFSVIASGQSPLTYQWSLNGTNLTNSAHINGATNASLTIGNVIAGDVGNYRVIVKNSHESVRRVRTRLSQFWFRHR